MYIIQLLKYMIWPVFIVICWFTIRFALSVYEKKLSDDESQPMNKDSFDSEK
jgi:hypothetical protein